MEGVNNITSEICESYAESSQAQGTDMSASLAEVASGKIGKRQ